jgi:hypothetical protein
MNKPEFPINYNGHGFATVLQGKIVNPLIARIPHYTLYKPEQPEYQRLKAEFEETLQKEFERDKALFDSFEKWFEVSSEPDFKARTSMIISKIHVDETVAYVCICASKRHIEYVKEQNERGAWVGSKVKLKPIKPMKISLTSFLSLLRGGQLYFRKP